MNPLNYSIDVKNPFEQAIGGFQLGSAITEMQAKRQQAELQRQQAIQMQQDLVSLAANPNPTARDYATVMTRYPQIAEHLKKGFDILQPAQQDARINSAAQVYAAVNSGANDVAINLLKNEAQAYRNSGNEQAARDAENWAKMIEISPQTAKPSMGLMLSSIMGKDKFESTFGGLGKEGRSADEAPADLAKKTADARKAQIDAKYAEQKALGDLAKQGWDIEKIQADIDINRQNSRINAMEAELKRETNALKRQELEIKISEAKRKHDDSIVEKVEKVESARYNMDNMLNTIDRIIKNPALRDVVGSLEGRDMYPNALVGAAAKAANLANPLYTPTDPDQRSDAIRLIETLGSQAFLSQIPQIKGTGALSNAEGDKLQAAFQNFSRVQSEEQFRANLNEAQRLILKARNNLVKSSGMPDTKPDRPTSEQRGDPSYLRYK